MYRHDSTMAHDGDLAKNFVFSNGIQQMPILPTSITTRKKSAFHQHWDMQGSSNHNITSTKWRVNMKLYVEEEKSLLPSCDLP